jgi:AraC-like DNA-binding protein
MFTGTLMQLSDVKALQAGNVPQELNCRFWSRADGQITVQHFRPTETVSYEPHTHSEYTILACLAGGFSMKQLGETHAIEAGELMMSNFGVEHTSNYLKGAREDCQAVCLAVDRRIVDPLLEPALLPLPDGSKSPVFIGKCHSPVIERCAQEIVHELQNRQLGQGIVVEGLASRMLIETLRTWPREQVEHCPVDWTQRLPRSEFVRAYEFMRWCRKDDFRLEQLCDFVGSSEERFTRLFRNAINASPAQFFNRMLLERSRILLQNPDLSIKKIRAFLGFKTNSHFIAAFRREFGVTPGDYRRLSEQSLPLAV